MDEYVADSLDLVEIANDIAEDGFFESYPILAFIKDRDYHRLENEDKVDLISTSKEVKLEDLAQKKVVFCLYKLDEDVILDSLADDWINFTDGEVIKVEVPLFLEYGLK